ncbi:hypothetical protein NADE_008185 [Nannochloris sp. 'desiccata']|nr:hypothetical protein NADE_008185 [Chlorella desiccata (nom. nud.)]
MMAVSVVLGLPVRILGAFVACALAPFLLLAQKFSELRLALAALICRIQVQRCVMGPYVLLYQNVVGGYHPNQDIEDAWRDLHSQLTTRAPHIAWSLAPSFRLCYDDQFAKPFGETCRSSLGYIVAKNCRDPEATAAAWRSLFTFSSDWQGHISPVKVDFLPRGECLAAFFPHQGRLSHSIAVGRLLLWSWCRQNTAFIVPSPKTATARPSKTNFPNLNKDEGDGIVIDDFGYATAQKIPGIMQICDPASRTLSFLLPLEERNTMLPFDLKSACRPWKIED